MNETFEPVLLFGKLCMFTDNRVKKSAIDKRLYRYELRHDDDGDWVDPVEISDSVIVNFAGTILSTEKLPIDLEHNYVMINEDDFTRFPEDDEIRIGVEYPHTLEDLIAMPNPTGWDISLKNIIQKPVRKHRIFISQPFTGMDDCKISKQRAVLTLLYCEYKGWNLASVDLINQHLPDDDFDDPKNFRDENALDAYRFCRSVGMMGKATDIIFYGNWQESRGCKIERDIAEKYHMNIIEQDTLIEFCKNNAKYDEMFEILWTEEFDNTHEVINPLSKEE